jgi:hypothetical protein
MPGNAEGRPHEQGAAPSSANGPGTDLDVDSKPAGFPDKQRARLRQLLAAIDLGEPMRRRAVQQVILQAESWWWAWRAEQFHAAAPRPGDYPGGPVDWKTGFPLNPPKADTSECLEAARACWSHAHLLAEEADDDDL